MKGYCVDVRGFSLEKKKIVIEAMGKLIGSRPDTESHALLKASSISNVGSNYGTALGIILGFVDITLYQMKYMTSFNDLMLEAGFNYEEHGVEDFKWIDWSERAATENKPTSNKTRPLITREQYDAVMAQSDKRTFTKALDDLLAIEKEQLLDELVIRVNELERENIDLVDVEMSSKIAISILRGKNDRLKEKIEKQRQISFSLSFILISSLAALLVGIFLGG